MSKASENYTNRCVPLDIMTNKDLNRTLEKDEEQLVWEINQIGFNIDTVYDFVNENSLDYSKAYPILVKHLKIDHHKKIKEGIIRALTVKNAKKIAGSILLEMFYNEKQENTKWVIANALKTILPLKDRKSHPEIKQVLGF